MSPRTEQQFEEIRRTNEKIILEASLSLFAEKGYNSTSMDSIAKKAKISKGNLYNYFENKEALLKDVLRYGLDECLAYFTVINSKLLTEDDFKKAIYTNFEMIKANESFWKLYYNLVTQPQVQDLFSKIFLPFLEEFMKIFETYFENKGDEHPFETALLLGSTLDGISLGYIMMGKTYPLDGVIKKLIEKFK